MTQLQLVYFAAGSDDDRSSYDLSMTVKNVTGTLTSMPPKA